MRRPILFNVSGCSRSRLQFDGQSSKIQSSPQGSRPHSQTRDGWTETNWAFEPKHSNYKDARSILSHFQYPSLSASLFNPFKLVKPTHHLSRACARTLKFLRLSQSAETRTLTGNPEPRKDKKNLPQRLILSALQSNHKSLIARPEFSPKMSPSLVSFYNNSKLTNRKWQWLFFTGTKGPKRVWVTEDNGLWRNSVPRVS